MERRPTLAYEDVSARIMRRARCSESSRYSTNAGENIQTLEEEKEKMLRGKDVSPKGAFQDFLSDVDELLQCWRWIARVEGLSSNQRNTIHENGNEVFNNNDHDMSIDWNAKGLNDAGVLKILRMTSRDFTENEGSNNWMDTKSMSETLFCYVFDSTMRR